MKTNQPKGFYRNEIFIISMLFVALLMYCFLISKTLSFIVLEILNNIKTTAYILIFILGITTCFSQNPNFKRDNSNMILSDFQRCEKFYNKITQSQSINLYKNQNLKTLNLISTNAETNNQENNATLINGNKLFTLNNSEFNSFLKYLKQKNIDFTDRKDNTNTITIKANSFKQIYIQSFDGFWIEINNSKN